MFGDIAIKTESTGEEFLQCAECVSKTRDGGVKDDLRPTKPMIFCSCTSEKSDRYIVEIFKEFIKRRPKEFLEPDSPMYLQYKTEKQLQTAKGDVHVWFKREVLGVNSSGKFLPKECELSVFPSSANDGVRATTMQRLGHKIIQITGFQTIRTLGIYDTDKIEI